MKFKIGQLVKLKQWVKSHTYYSTGVYLVVTAGKNMIGTNSTSSSLYRLYNLNTKRLHLSIYRNEDLEIP